MTKVLSLSFTIVPVLISTPLAHTTRAALDRQIPAPKYLVAVLAACTSYRRAPKWPTTGRTDRIQQDIEALSLSSAQ